MITPFKSDGTVDEKALRRFVDFQIEGGVDMLLPCGTTGEGATLDENETDRVVRWKAGSDVSALAGKPARLRFVMKDAKLFAFQFSK